MKKITLILSALLIAVMTLVSCGGGGNPKDAASSFINAMNKFDLKTAKNYVTDASKPGMDKMIEQMNGMPADQKKKFDDMVAARSKITVTIKDVKENGDKATVTFSTSEDASRVDSVEMLKQNGKWLADFKGF